MINAKASFIPWTTMQGQILFSLKYSRTKAADMTLVSIVGPKPKNFKWSILFMNIYPDEHMHIIVW
jgi:hypothetical protein